MIYDVLENLNQYTGMFETLDEAIAYLEECDLENLPEGVTSINEELGIYLTVSEETPLPTEQGRFETHSNHFEIHIDLEGSELVEIALGELEELIPYEEKTDTAYWQADCSAACALDSGRFLLTMTEEPFKPLIASQGCHVVRKCVVTIPRIMPC